MKKIQSKIKIEQQGELFDSKFPCVGVTLCFHAEDNSCASFITIPVGVISEDDLEDFLERVKRAYQKLEKLLKEREFQKRALSKKA